MEDRGDLIKSLEAQLSEMLESSSELVKKIDLQKLYTDYNQRLSISNDAFLKEVRNFSIICIAAAPFSLTLLSAEAQVEKSLLIIAFILFVGNVAFLNIGEWYLNSKFRSSVGSEFLDVMQIDTGVSEVLNSSLSSLQRTNALAAISEGQLQLEVKKMHEPIDRAKILDTLRETGLLMLIVGIEILIFSVIPIFKI